MGQWVCKEVELSMLKYWKALARRSYQGLGRVNLSADTRRDRKTQSARTMYDLGRGLRRWAPLYVNITSPSHDGGVDELRSGFMNVDRTRRRVHVFTPIVFAFKFSSQTEWKEDLSHPIA
jgi:hypothetical protein